jgi:predicted transcriptional regulator
METVATSVRIAGDAIGSLAELSKKLRKSKAQVIEMALKEMEERIFWDEVRAAHERLANDPVELAKYKAEFEAWDRGTALRYEQEEW